MFAGFQGSFPCYLLPEKRQTALVLFMRRKTSKTRRYRHPVKVLKAEVMSPLIAWFTFLSVLRLVTKFALSIGILLGLAYGIRQAIEHTFHKNPDFQKKVLNIPPMLHCKVSIPPWISDKKEKFDINWEDYQGLNKFRLFRLIKQKTKFG